MDILDDLDSNKNDNKTYSYISFEFGIIQLVLLLIVVKCFYDAKYLLIDRSDFLTTIVSVLLLTSIPAFIVALASIVTHEANSIFKWIGSIINFSMIAMFFVVLIFALI